ncbi:MAG: hypothetical protein NTV49_07535 [Kiritimatiellaeota bacterium]|nr:hypothetical protein [Kiritimatiellota bacterium]
MPQLLFDLVRTAPTPTGFAGRLRSRKTLAQYVLNAGGIKRIVAALGLSARSQFNAAGGLLLCRYSKFQSAAA